MPILSPNVLLSFMLAAYSIPIAFVYFKYASAPLSRSISSIITSTEPFCLFAAASNAPPPTVFQTRHFIALCMLIMAAFTVLYETHRARWSLAVIIVLLSGIFGVIFVPEQNPTHYIFAAAAFFAIIGFMVGHTFYGSTSTSTSTGVVENLRLILYAQFLFTVVTIIGVIQDAPIFIVEALFLLNFAVFYLYLHYTSVSSFPDPGPGINRTVSCSSSPTPVAVTAPNSMPPLVIR